MLQNLLGQFVKFTTSLSGMKICKQQMIRSSKLQKYDLSLICLSLLIELESKETFFASTCDSNPYSSPITKVSGNLFAQSKYNQKYAKKNVKNIRLQKSCAEQQLAKKK